MSRYIDADALYEELGRHKEMMAKQGGWSAPIIASSIDIVQRRIKGYPTADVAPIVHAHWTCVNTTENVYMCDGKDGCGNCTILLEGTPKENDMLFCAHCGAKMDEEVKK